MGDIVPFERKQSLEFPMVFNANGIGINPASLKRIHVHKNNTIYFVFEQPENMNKDTPSCGMLTPSQIDACTSAIYLKDLIKKEYDKDIEVHYDKC